MMQVHLEISPFFKLGKWRTEMLSNLAKITKLTSDKSQDLETVCTFNH